MRTVKRALGFVAICLVLAPAPAQAWWGWLDDLSGPGRFRGPLFEFRLICFGPESEAKRLVDDLKNAVGLTRKIEAGGGEAARVDAVAARDAWRQLLNELSSTPLTFPVLDPGAVNDAVRSVEKNLDSYFTLLENSGGPTVTIDKAKMTTLLSAATDTFEPLIAEVVRGISAIGSTGVLLSACSTDTKRRSSIELGVNFLYADGNSGFANSQQIRLTTLMPTFSFRVFTDPRFDVLDAGAGAGVYWFTSRGFPSFSGVILEPARFDLHAPTVWSTYRLDSASHVVRRIAAAPTFRFSLVQFPGGFAPTAFAGVGEHRVRIPAELLKSWGIFINFDPFVRKAPFVKSTK